MMANQEILTAFKVNLLLTDGRNGNAELPFKQGRVVNVSSNTGRPGDKSIECCLGPVIGVRRGRDVAYYISLQPVKGGANKRLVIPVQCIPEKNAVYVPHFAIEYLQ